MSTKTLNGSTPQAAEELIKKSSELSKRLLEKHNIQMPKVSMPEPKLRRARTAAYYESGMALNITNGIQVVDYVITYGTDYNPSNPALAVASLQALNAQGQALLDNSNAKRQDKKVDIDTRQSVYGDLKPLATRVLNELIACGAPKATVANARHYVNKIRGKRIGAVNPNNPGNLISASQTSFTEQIQHFTNLINVVSGCSVYTPNITELTVTALEAKRTAMMNSNSAVSTTQAVWSTSRIERNAFFNAEGTGYVDTFLAVKAVVKAIFGANSPQYRQVSDLAFKRIDD